MLSESSWGTWSSVSDTWDTASTETHKGWSLATHFIVPGKVYKYCIVHELYEQVITTLQGDLTVVFPPIPPIPKFGVRKIRMAFGESNAMFRFRDRCLVWSHSQTFTPNDESLRCDSQEARLCLPCPLGHSVSSANNA